MSLTFADAREEMYRQVYEAWIAANPTYPMTFDDRPAQKPDTSTPWARASVRHNVGDQEALANPLGNKLFSRDGLFTVQIFTPMGAGLRAADTLAKVVADALEGQATPGGVWFRRVRVREIGPDGAFFHINVVAEFEYSEAK